MEWAEKIGLGFELTAGGLNDKDAALAAGYSISVAENTLNNESGNRKWWQNMTESQADCKSSRTLALQAGADEAERTQK